MRELKSGAKSKQAGKAGAKPGKAREQRSREFVNDLLEKVKEQMKAADYKVSVADLIRLLQLQKELEEESVEEITVRWVEGREEK